MVFQRTGLRIKMCAPATIRLCSLDRLQIADFYLWHGQLATDLWYGNQSVAEGDFYAVGARAGWYPTSKKILP
jgi:hypothetical protein